MARRLHQTLADTLVIALSPALIMTLIGSLVFFLLAVFYQGEFTGRLHWVMACFVFAAVLIGRISIEEGFERAAPFGAALALVVGIAANRFVEYQGTWLDQFGWVIHGALIALIWWCAHRLTWDCTLIDEAQDASGEGLLQVAGLERPADQRQSTSTPVAKQMEGTTSRDVPAGFWQRYVEGQRRPHAPGVWVVYFSLAALPLFGIGQWFIPEANVAGRRYAFWLMSVYVASGLGLLLTTSFLGLRRYLRQRRIEMPTLMANLWLGTGAIVIGLLLVLAALLPRPSAEYAISRLPFAVGSPNQRASSLAPVAREGTRDELSEDKSAPGHQPKNHPQEPEPTEPTPADSPAGSGSQDPADPQGDSEASQSPGKTENDKADKTAQGDSRKSQSSANQGSKRGQASKPSQQGNEPPKPKEPTDRRSESAKATQRVPEERAEQKPETSPRNETDPQQPDNADQPLEAAESGLETVASGIVELLRWVFYAVFILAVLYGLWRMRAEVFAAIRDFLAALREFWNGLLGRKRAPKVAGLASEERVEFPPIPFASFADPFASGIDARYSTEELVRYSFEAFEAWAREHGCPRQPDQTPHEWAREVAKLNPFITTDARNLAELYARAAYAHGELPPTSRDPLRRLWQTMQPDVASVP